MVGKISEDDKAPALPLMEPREYEVIAEIG
jgi:hypothetical protein